MNAEKIVSIAVAALAQIEAQAHGTEHKHAAKRLARIRRICQRASVRLNREARGIDG